MIHSYDNDYDFNGKEELYQQLKDINDSYTQVFEFLCSKECGLFNNKLPNVLNDVNLKKVADENHHEIKNFIITRYKFYATFNI